MLIRRPPSILPSEITAEAVYLQRREFLRLAGITAAGVAASACSADVGDGGGDDAPGGGAAGPAAAGGDGRDGAGEPAPDRFANAVPSRFSTDEAPNSWQDITTYNNFYEFGTGKSDPARNAGSLRTRPWQVRVHGECDRPATVDIDDLLAPHTFEDRVYRLRCVEAWSMVVPWVGIGLGDVLKRFAPTSRARYVTFRTLYDPKQMPGQRRRVLDWPYQEGLTIAEAMHPLALLAVGVYGKPLPNQNGAPLRLVVPWKYGFKSIKSIVDIEFTEQRPVTSWEAAAPSEYGFYANVNPNVDHPRWSQARHREIGAGLFAEKVPTQMFNGYADEVADLYAGLDLRRNF